MAHHPRGASSEDTGAFAVDWDSWKVWKYEIFRLEYYQNLVDCIVVIFSVILAYFENHSALEKCSGFKMCQFSH